MKFSAKQWCLALILALSLPSLLTGCLTGLPASVKAVRNLEYARVGHTSLLLDIYSPRNPAGKLPVLVWIHGGSWNSGSKDPCPIAFIAARGFAIVSINYRLTETATFPAQLYDCKGVVRWLRAHADEYNLDADHIGIASVSAGGHLGLLLATTANHPELEGNVGGNLNFSSRVQCVCAFYAPTDLDRLVSDPQVRTNANGDVAKLIGGAISQYEEKAHAASPITYVDETCPPIYLLHGAEDKLVPPEQSRLFYDALLKARVPAQLTIVPHKGHGIIAPPDAAQEIFAFFDRYLKNGAAGAK